MPYYPWPASGISSSEMGLLHRARESSHPRVAITELIRRAVVAAYGEQGSATDQKITNADETLEIRRAA